MGPLKLVVTLSTIDAPGPGYGDFYGVWVGDDGSQGADLASGIDVTGTPAATTLLLQQSFADTVNAELGSTLTAADVLVI